MLSIKILAVCLLSLHAISSIYIYGVLRKQVALLKAPITPALKHFRYVLLSLSVVIFIGNIVPIVIDGLTLFVNTGRPANLRIVSILYAFSNALTALVSAYLIHTLYRLAANEHDISEFSDSQLTDEQASRLSDEHKK